MNGNAMVLARSAEADGGSCRKYGVGHARLGAASRLCGGYRQLGMGQIGADTHSDPGYCTCSPFL